MHKQLSAILFCTICLYLPTSGYLDSDDQTLHCMWTDCGVDDCSEVDGHPFKLESGACLQPDGQTCVDGISVLCCTQPGIHNPYWSGTPPNCAATCEDCTLKGDFCYGYTRKCNNQGENCISGSEILCGAVKHTNVGAIVGGTVGGIVAVILAIIGVSGLVCCSKNDCKESCRDFCKLNICSNNCYSEI